MNYKKVLDKIKYKEEVMKRKEAIRERRREHERQMWEGLKEWWSKWGRVIISLAIVIGIAWGIYSYAKRNPAEKPIEPQTELVQLETESPEDKSIEGILKTLEDKNISNPSITMNHDESMELKKWYIYLTGDKVIEGYKVYIRENFDTPQEMYDYIDNLK